MVFPVKCGGEIFGQYPGDIKSVNNPRYKFTYINGCAKNNNSMELLGIHSSAYYI